MHIGQVSAIHIGDQAWRSGPHHEWYYQLDGLHVALCLRLAVVEELLHTCGGHLIESLKDYETLSNGQRHGFSARVNGASVPIQPCDSFYDVLCKAGVSTIGSSRPEVGVERIVDYFGLPTSVAGLR